MLSLQPIKTQILPKPGDVHSTQCPHCLVSYDLDSEVGNNQAFEDYDSVKDDPFNICRHVCGGLVRFAYR